MNFLKHRSLNTKLIMLVFLGIIPIILGLIFYVFPVFEESFILQKKAEVKATVDLTVGMIDLIQSEVENGKITIEKGKEDAKKFFTKMKYNETDYMFAYDTKGFCVAHGSNPKLIGQDRSQTKDPTGKLYVQDFMRIAEKGTDGFVEYKYEKEKGGTPIDKISYIKFYPKWGWIVGSGVYVDVIQAQVKSIKIKVYSGLGIISLLAFIFSWFYAKNLTQKLNHTAIELEEEANKVSEIAESIAKTSEQLSSSTQEQAAALQETSASVEETSAMIEKNAENAQKSIDISTRSQQNVDEGKQIVRDMIQSIQEIAESNQNIIKQIDESNQDISNIVKIINEIGNKTKVINDIVFQTKLLSFNASVEAARAGEHGKGFAVVAEEVGKLAEMSGTSSREISEMLNVSIQNVESTINKSKTRIQQMVTEGEKKIQYGSDIAEKCGQLFDVIVTNVNQVNDMVGEISSASSEQANGIKEINTAVIELDSVGQQNSSMSQQTSRYSEQLKDQVVALRKMTNELNQTING